jgi:hypothetical protein
VLPYDAVRRDPSPHEAIQSFYRSAFHAGAERAGWSSDLEIHSGITDPVLS